MFVGAAGPVRAANSAKGGSWGATHKGWGHGRIHLTNELSRNLLEGFRCVGASEGRSFGFLMRLGKTGDATTVSSAWITVAQEYQPIYVSFNTKCFVSQLLKLICPLIVLTYIYVFNTKSNIV